MKKILAGILNLFKRYRLWQLGLAGKTMKDVHDERVISGKAWEEFCDTIKMAGTAMVFNGAPTDSFNQAEGYRYLSRLVRAGLEAFVEYADPANPQIRRMVHETIKLGADNPDNFYFNSRISGEYEYRLYGNRGSAHYLAFATQMADYMKDGPQVTGSIEAEDLVLEPNGDFELILSINRPANAKNWLPITKDTRILLIRQTFLNKEVEKLADLKIERIGAGKYPGPIDTQTVDEGLANAGMFVTGSALYFAKWSNDWRAHKNLLPEHPREISQGAGGDPNISYYHSYWEMADDEAIVVEFMPPACQYWNFQLNNYWIESLDYRYFNININKHTAKYNADGSVKIIVAHTDPGLPNWINTAYHKLGTMSLRWVRSTECPPIKTRVVKFSELKAQA